MGGKLKVHLGVKSDPIENRFSFDWLFNLLKNHGIRYLQIGGFFELLVLEDDYFEDLRRKALEKNIVIKSLFTTHRVIGGFFRNNKFFERAARKIYERYIHVGSLLGVDYVGSGGGAVFRDRLYYKEKGIECFLKHMKELMEIGKRKKIRGLSIEIMSCTAEPPATPEEIDYMMGILNEYHLAHRENTVPVHLLGDISHGYVNKEERVLYTNFEIFEYAIPYMIEFHIKNTDRVYNETFGFTPEEMSRGIIDLFSFRKLIFNNEHRWPENEVFGYLEIPGPKLGRDYSDYKLEYMLTESLKMLKKAFLEKA